MKKILLALLVLMAFAQTALCQEIGKYSNSFYKRSIGVIGLSFGITYKQEFASSDAVEVVAQYDSLFWRVSGYYDIHWIIPGTGIRTVFGPGFSIGGRTKSKIINPNIDGSLFFGPSVMVGLEYKFKNLPIAIGVQAQPTYDVSASKEFYTDWYGGSIRYVF
jgi:hypothetical protein